MSLWFSSGASTNPFSMYCTSNAASYQKPKSNPCIGKPPVSQDQEKICSAYRNNPPFIPVKLPPKMPANQTLREVQKNRQERIKNQKENQQNKLLSGFKPYSRNAKREKGDSFGEYLIDPNKNDFHRVSLAKASFTQENSTKGSLQDHDALIHEPVTITGRSACGHGKNLAGYGKKKQIGAKSRGIDDPTLLRTMRLHDPVNAERGGKGPEAYETTKNWHEGLATKAKARQLPKDVREVSEFQEATRLLAGGFSTNNGVLGGPSRFRIESETSYGQTIGHGKSPKYFKDISDDLKEKEALKTSLKQPKHVSGFSFCDFPADMISKKNEKVLKEEQNRDRKIHPATLMSLKIHNPVLYDEIAKKRNHWSTINRNFHNAESVKSKPIPKNPRLNEVVRTGFSSNATQPLAMKRIPGTMKSLSSKSYSSRVLDRRLNDHPTTSVTSAYGRQCKGQTVRKEFPNISSALESDVKLLATYHPTIQKMLRHADPARYDPNTVSTYHHKRRN